MDDSANLPSLPTPAVRNRITKLGYGSGPWSRSELAKQWGDAVAGKTIQEAKDLGWLVSPYQGQFYVPSARDLMVAAWLPSAQRTELVVSRTFAKTGLRYWCLSAWARTQGLLFSEPLFVTDLTPMREGPPVRRGTDFTLNEMADRARAQAKTIKRVPFAANTIIVPALGSLSKEWMRARVELGARPKRVPRSEDDEISSELEEQSPTIIEYDVSRELGDAGWLIAFLNALRLPRIQEGVQKLMKSEWNRAEQPRGKPYWEDIMDSATWWAAFFAPPSPNENWKAVLASGSLPYLLVPPSLWDETIDLTASRAYDDMTRLRRQLDA